METILVELNQRHADYSSRGEYRCKLATPVTINDGDQLSFRMCSLDSNKTDTDTIIIENDQPITALFSYYDVDYDLRDKSNSTGTAAYTGNNGEPFYDYFPVYAQQQLMVCSNITMQILNPSKVQGSAEQPHGGSFIFDTYTTYTDNGPWTVDPICQFKATFSYIDENSELQYVTFSGGNAVQVGGVDHNPNFIPQKDSRGYYAFYFDLFTLTGDTWNPFTFIQGTLQLASISGNWAGIKWSDSNSTYSAAADPPGKVAGDYDTTYKILSTDIGILNLDVAPIPETFTPQQLVLKTFNGVIPAGRYAPESLATILTQLMESANGVYPYQTDGSGNQTADQVYAPVNPFLTRTNLPENATWQYRLNNFDKTVLNEDITFDNSNTYTYITPDVGVAAYSIGSDRMSIEYGKSGAVFQVTYCHMPIVDPTGSPENIALYYTGTNNGTLKYFPISKASGVVFHRLEPYTFWQQSLGLADKLIVPINTAANDVKFYYRDSLIKCTTSGFQGIGTFDFPAVEDPPPIPPAPQTYQNPRKMQIPPKANPSYFDCTGQAKAIIGEAVSINTDGGFYLIELLSSMRRQGGYIDSKENRHQISAVVSSQYDSNNAITGYADSGIPYVHHGLPYLMSECTVRILNPLTKNPATNLGVNNCVWIQIDKIAQAPASTGAEKPITVPLQEQHAGVQNVEPIKAKEAHQILHQQLKGREIADKLHVPVHPEDAQMHTETPAVLQAIREVAEIQAKAKDAKGPADKAEAIRKSREVLNRSTTTELHDFGRLEFGRNFNKIDRETLINIYMDLLPLDQRQRDEPFNTRTPAIGEGNKLVPIEIKKRVVEPANAQGDVGAAAPEPAKTKPKPIIERKIPAAAAAATPEPAKTKPKPIIKRKVVEGADAGPEPVKEDA